jgi:hypothetical protein
MQTFSGLPLEIVSLFPASQRLETQNVERNKFVLPYESHHTTMAARETRR